MDQTNAAISVRGLRRSYGTGSRAFEAVRGVDLDVARGTITALLGTNGAGKTSTLEVVEGLARPSAGEVRVLGLDPVRDADRLRPQVGSQLQDSALPDRLRVGEAVALFARSRGPRGDELLERFGLAARRRSPFAGLSGGERQRLFLVLALLGEPRLVVLDELTQGLDPAARREVWSAVAQLRDGGTTVLLVTHELAEAEALCGRVVAMRAGRVLDAGSPAELVARHAARATVRFSCPDDASGLRALPGVAEVARDGATVTVRGERQVIAHVGAWLVRRGPVPADLSVDVPDLESALLALLDGASSPSLSGAA